MIHARRGHPAFGLGGFTDLGGTNPTVLSYAREHETAPLYGSCRTIHADVLLAKGRWEDAERALQSALDVHARYVPQLAVPTVAALAELRVRQGRLSEAERLLGYEVRRAAGLDS